MGREPPPALPGGNPCGDAPEGLPRPPEARDAGRRKAGGRPKHRATPPRLAEGPGDASGSAENHHETQGIPVL